MAYWSISKKINGKFLIVKKNSLIFTIYMKKKNYLKKSSEKISIKKINFLPKNFWTNIEKLIEIKFLLEKIYQK